jgi:hypothetical protein
VRIESAGSEQRGTDAIQILRLCWRKGEAWIVTGPRPEPATICRTGGRRHTRRASGSLDDVLVVPHVALLPRWLSQPCFSSTSWCPESSVRSRLFPYKRQGPVTCSKVPALARSTSTGGISGAGTSCRQRRRWIIAETKGDMEVLPSAAGEAHDERATVRLVCSVCRVHEIHVSSVNEFVTAPHRRCNKKVHKNLWLFCFRRCTNKQSRAITRRGPRRLPFPRPRARSAERGWLSFPGPARWSTIAGRQPGSRAGVH